MAMQSRVCGNIHKEGIIVLQKGLDILILVILVVKTIFVLKPRRAFSMLTEPVGHREACVLQNNSFIYSSSL